MVDSSFALRDGRMLAWCDYGEPAGTPVLRLQGTPASRLFRYPHPELWEELGVRVLMADRPGYGGSSRLAGHGLNEVADDLVELLDREGIDRIRVAGYSGGGPYVLALCARHGDRIAAATVVVGAAPIQEADVPLLVGVNAEAHRRMSTGGWSSLHELLTEQRTALLEDPLAGFRAAMSGAPESDRAVMTEPAWQEMMKASIREALRPGAEGWTDESMAVFGAWDLAVERVQTPVVWWHGRHDANAPLQAVERVTRRLPNVDLRIWENAGHLEPYHREAEILEDLLAR